MATPDDLAQRLERVQKRIDAHPLASAAVKSAGEVIDRHGKENVDAVSKELFERGLPSLVELGRLQVRHMFTWWNLHRRRRNLERS